jgi:hypothetical protein
VRRDLVDPILMLLVCPVCRTVCLPGIKWDGGCFARQGAAKFDDHSLNVIASGARTIVTNIYFRSTARAMGETNVLDALKQAGFASELARCPVQGTIGGTNWYRLQSASTSPGVLSIQSSCNGKPCEGFQLTLGADLPQLQPRQLAMYSERCSGAPEARRAVSTSSPQELIAQSLSAFIRPHRAEHRIGLPLPRGQGIRSGVSN